MIIVRNRIIFQNESFNDNECFELWRFEFAWWIKAEWGEQVPSVVDIIRCLGDVEVPRCFKKSGNWVWALPAIGQIKVNVDVSFLGAMVEQVLEGYLEI